MKKTLIILAYIIICKSVTAQKLDVQLKDLVVPSSAAFSVLDFTPKIIERPGTIKSLALNVVNQVGESAGFPKNFATEFAPYWFFENHNMNIFKYYGIKHTNDKYTGQNVFSNLRSTSASLGSLFRDSSKKLPVDINYLSYGVRANIISVRSTFVLKSIYDRILAINKSLGEHLTQVDCSSIPDDSIRQRLDCLGKNLEKALKKDSILTVTRSQFSELVGLRPWLAVDIALASSTAFGRGSISNSKRYRTGAWATLSLSIPFAKKADIEQFLKNKNYFNGYILLRSIDENQTMDFVNFAGNKYLDIGGRAELELNRFSLSIESIHRSNADHKNLNTSRTVGLIQYRVTDNLYFSGTFGKDFGEVQNLISLFGINWGFGGNTLFENLK